MFKDKQKVHFIGIGGIGMSGVAQLILAQGVKVSGSDLKASLLTEKMRNIGAEIFIGHSAGNVKDDVDCVVYTSAVKADNPELVTARSRDIPLLARAAALSLLAQPKKLIAVTGAHGKTTTTSLIAHMLGECGVSPTICVGGEILSLNANARWGNGEYFVAEADESDASFLYFNPFYSVVTNIDREHLDYYHNEEQIREAFVKFIQNTAQEGCIFFCQDDPALKKIACASDKTTIGFGLTLEADIYAAELELSENRVSFQCVYRGETLGRIDLQVPGRHNAYNALAAVALGLRLGLDFAMIRQALSSYRGVKRRLHLKLQEKEILIFDDYAHHPTEIRASLAALRNFGHKRILAVFQPHRYTRTKYLIEEFATCFHDADSLIITDIYAASEPPIPGVSAEAICRKAQDAGARDVCFLPKEDIVENLLRRLCPGDLVAVMGAGDIGNVADVLAERVRCWGKV